MAGFIDVEVHSTDEMNAALGAVKHKPGIWAIAYANGDMAYYPNEELACAAQREWRRDHGRNEMTGE